MHSQVIKIHNSSSEMVTPKVTELHANLAVSAAAVSFLPANLASTCKYVRLQVQTAAVRVSYDGSAPTATNGELVEAGQMAVYSRDLVLAMRFIAVAGDAVIWAQPFNCLAQ